MTDTAPITVRLPALMAKAATEVADQRNISRSGLLRIALEQFLEGLSGTTELDRRKQFTSEYTFLALDLLIQRQYPEVHTTLLAEAERRMEALHGAS